MEALLVKVPEIEVPVPDDAIPEIAVVLFNRYHPKLVIPTLEFEEIVTGFIALPVHILF